MKKSSLCGLSPDEILLLARNSELTLPGAIVISNSIYKKRLKEILDFPKITKKVKIEINKNFITGLYSPESCCKSVDNTKKYLFRNDRGQQFETVYLPDDKRKTICVSSQSGCRMKCPFCVTGRYGFRGNLSAQDIINQIISIPESDKVTHVVFMGMGEPMDNLDNVLKACSILTAEWGLAISTRNITVSTVGIAPGVKRFLERSKCNLTLSLYSPFPEERYKVIPVEKRYPAKEIVDIMKNDQSGIKRRMSIAYVMIKDINDTERHLEGLKTLLRYSRIRVNLLPYHSIPGDLDCSSTAERMQHFKHELIISGISASIRKSRGIDVSAACGLLASGLEQ